MFDALCRQCDHGLQDWELEPDDFLSTADNPVQIRFIWRCAVNQNVFGWIWAIKRAVDRIWALVVARWTKKHWIDLLTPGPHLLAISMHMKPNLQESMVIGVDVFTNASSAN